MNYKAAYRVKHWRDKRAVSIYTKAIHQARVPAEVARADRAFLFFIFAFARTAREKQSFHFITSNRI